MPSLLGLKTLRSVQEVGPGNFKRPRLAERAKMRFEVTVTVTRS
jgi:hypothetical protein